ncbi:MAG: DUF507 family protein [Thermoanaerobaculia bacterium]
MKASSDRILYLARMISRKLKENMNLVQKADDETVQRAVTRVLTESYEELEAIEQKVQDSVGRRKRAPGRDQEFLFAKGLEEELRKRGA